MSKKTKHPNWGGARKGAGRKPQGLTYKNSAVQPHGGVLSAKDFVSHEHVRIGIETLIRVAQDKKLPAQAQVSAATRLLEYGLGKPSVQVNVDGSALRPIVLDLPGLLDSGQETIAQEDMEHEIVDTGREPLRALQKPDAHEPDAQEPGAHGD